MEINPTMRKFKDIAVPERMQHLPKDRRGYPIPSVVFRDKEGQPHFTVNDEAIRQQHIAGDLCAISGKRLHRGRWFVGGPRSAFDPNGAYYDTPTHYDCLEYALKVCPYLAMPSYTKRIEGGTLKGKEEEHILMDPTMMPGKPDLFVAVMCVGVDAHVDPVFGYVKYLRPKRPYRIIEFWKDGRKLSQKEAFPILSRTVPADHMKACIDKHTVIRWGEEQ